MEAALAFILVVMAKESAMTAAEDGMTDNSSELHNVPFIVNGEDASPGRWPWMVSLHYGGFHVCGGVLLSENFVLTAAHCEPNSYMEVVLGSLDLTNDAGDTRKIRWWSIHPGYDNRIYSNDIAVVKLEVPVSFTANIQPALLPKTTDNFVGTDCVATGWGYTDGTTGDSPSVLQEAPLPVISNLECQVKLIETGVIHSSSICVYDAKSVTCQGDSGGPLQCKRCSEEPWVVSGVNSWGPGSENDTCTVDEPDVFVRTSNYIEWIQEQTNYEVRVVDLDNDGECSPWTSEYQSSSVMLIVNSFSLLVLTLACTLAVTGRNILTYPL